VVADAVRAAEVTRTRCWSFKRTRELWTIYDSGVVAEDEAAVQREVSRGSEPTVRRGRPRIDIQGKVLWPSCAHETRSLTIW
jgi:hypothetical protein